MKKFIFQLIILLCPLSSLVFGQQMKITGTVFDTSGTQKIKEVVVMAVRMKDSLLLKNTRSKEDGTFELSNFPIDTFTLIVEHPLFEPKTYYIFGNKDNYDINIPKITLSEKSKELNEVVIFANKNPIYYRGDTLVYVADSFKVGENAVVEDLLKKLPGIKVDENGQITSQGKQISQVLVVHLF